MGKQPENGDDRQLPTSPVHAGRPTAVPKESNTSSSISRRERREENKFLRGYSSMNATTATARASDSSTGAAVSRRERREEKKYVRGDASVNESTVTGTPRAISDLSTKSTAATRRQRREEKLLHGGNASVNDEHSIATTSLKIKVNATYSPSITSDASASASTTRRQRKENKVLHGGDAIINEGTSAETSRSSNEERAGWRASREERHDDEYDDDLESGTLDEDEERPGAFAVGVHHGMDGSINILYQDDISALSPTTIAPEDSLRNIPIAAELVEDHPTNVSDIVAEVLRQQLGPGNSNPPNESAIQENVAKVLRQQQFQQMPSPPVGRDSNLSKESRLQEKVVATAVIVEEKRICGIPQIWVRVAALTVFAVGLAVAMSVVFANSKGGNGNVEPVDSPSPTVFELEPTVPQITLEIALIAQIQGRASRDFFGHYVEFSRDGTTVAIGAPGSDPYVRIYRWTKGSFFPDWVQVGQTIDSGSGDVFGHRLELNQDGNILVLGAPKNDNEGQDRGLVQVYEYNGSDAWVQLGQDMYGLELKDQFGLDVAISDDGQTIVSTGFFGDPGGRVNAGYVQVFTLSNGTESNNDTLSNGTEWVQLGPTLEGEVAGDLFGKSVDISGNGRRVAVGAVLGAAGNGRIHVFDYVEPDGDDDGSWKPTGIRLDGLNDQDWQGTSVALSGNGNIIAIGADGHDTAGNNAGMVRVYQLVGCCGWVQYGTAIFGEATSDQLGAGQVSLSTDGQLVAVGANLNGNSTGKAYLYQFSTKGGGDNDDWDLVDEIVGDVNDDKLGFAVAVSGDGSLFAAGAPRTSRDLPGYVKIYSVEGQT